MGDKIVLAGSLYDSLLCNGVPDNDIDHHCSDLYVRITPLTVKVVKEYQEDRQIQTSPKTFRSEIEGDGIWYEFPFEYMPYWNKADTKEREEN